MQHLLEKGEILLPKREIKPKIPGRLNTFRRRCIRSDKQIDWISDRADTEEYGDRRCEQNASSLDTAIREPENHI